MPTMNYDVVEGVLVTVHGREQPTEDEYTTWLRSVQSFMDTQSIQGVVIYTGGGYPDVHQRRQTALMWSKYTHIPNIAVLHNSVIVRGVLTALGWVIGKTLQGFNYAQVVPACAHVGLPDDRVPAVHGTIRRLARSVNIEVP